MTGHIRLNTSPVARTTAVYALSADPITFGHVNIVERAASCFDEVIVAIGTNPLKGYLFSTEERTQLAEQALAQFNNIRVVAFHGLLIDFAYEQGACVIVKGVRNSQDFAYENMLHQVGETQKLGIDTHLLFADPTLTHVSSSNVKALQIEHGFIQDYVPLAVKAAIEKKLSGQTIIGVTGQIAAGKSTLCDSLVEYGKTHGLNIHNIDLDRLGHEILCSDTAPYAVEARKRIAETFGKQVMIDNLISRKHLGPIVFGSPEKMALLNEILRKPLLLKLRRANYGKKGLILINAALIVEANLLGLCNNRVVVVDASDAIQQQRLMARGHSAAEASTRVSHQFDKIRKTTLIKQAITDKNFGQVWRYASNGSQSTEQLMIDIQQVTGAFA